DFAAGGRAVLWDSENGLNTPGSCARYESDNRGANWQQISVAVPINSANIACPSEAIDPTSRPPVMKSLAAPLAAAPRGGTLNQRRFYGAGDELWRFDPSVGTQTCPNQALLGFARVLATQPGVRDALGCPA